MQKELEIMRVLRLPPRGKLVVEVNGRRYDTLDEVMEEDARRRLTAAIGELIVFAGNYNRLVDAGVAPAIQAAPGRADAATTTAADTLAQQQAAFLESLEKERDALKSAPPRPRTRIPLISPRPLETAEPPSAAAPPQAKLSIVEQIDAILQKHVAAEPLLANRAIHLEQGAGGGLRILVDGRYYERPGDIEEKEIQLALKMALKEWEQQ